jgi:hypothetical protein
MALRQRPAGATGRKPRKAVQLPKMLESKIPSRHEDPFHGEDSDLAIVEKLKGRPVEELRELLKSLQGKRKPRLQMLLVRKILAAQRKGSRAAPMDGIQSGKAGRAAEGSAPEGSAPRLFH